MGYDNTRNRGSEIRPDVVDGRGGSGNSTMIDRDAEKSDTKWKVDVLTGIIEADGAVCQRTVAEQEGDVVGGTSHRTIIRVGEGR